MKALFTSILLLLSAPLLAETAIYFNPDAVGEGITVHENDGMHVVFFFTYGGLDCELIETTAEVSLTATATATATAACPVDKDGKKFDEDCEPVTVDETVSETEVFTYPVYDELCTLDDQRWFMMADEYKKAKGWIEGTFYWAQGIDYPIGEISPTNPFEYNVGEVIPVGNYVLQETAGGYQLRVFQLEEDPVLTDDDPIFNVIYDFNTLLFAPGTGD